MRSTCQHWVCTLHGGLTKHAEETAMKLTGEQTRRQLAQVRLEQASDRMRVPALVLGKQVDVALLIEALFQTLDNSRRSTQAVDTLLLLGILGLQVLDAAEHNRRETSNLRDRNRVGKRHAEHGL